MLASIFAGGAQACDGSVQTWSQRYLQLRIVPGHFAGGAWTPAVDTWGGEKHRLMQCLAEHAAAGALPAARVRAVMGAPDEQLRCPSAACAELIEKAEWRLGTAPAKPAQLWLYHWRGRHDRLVLPIGRGGVRGAGWLYERE